MNIFFYVANLSTLVNRCQCSQNWIIFDNFSKTSSLNFFIYCFACEGFRTSFKDLIRTSSTWRRPTLMSQSSEVTVVWEERDILARSKVRCVQCELDTTRLFLTNVPEISCFTPWRKCFGNFGGNVTLTFGGKTSQKQRTAFQNSSIVCSLVSVHTFILSPVRRFYKVLDVVSTGLMCSVNV